MLAAGASSRYGGVKQQELLPAILEALRRTTLSQVVVVEGAHPLHVDSAQARVVRCEDWERGPGASLRCGLSALAPHIERAVVALADGPGLDPRAVERLLESDAPYAAASYDGSRSHPVLLARSGWNGIPDEGLRHRQPVLVDCSDLRPPGDVDFRR
ncbi:MAG: NTP transferase domain-containing protein [Gaiellaceae bacterium]